MHRSAPGGTYILAPPPLGTNADAGNQQRGGPGGLVTPTTTITATANSASEAAGPTATQSGIAKNCNNYAAAKAGDNCYDFAKAHGITPGQLYAWNAVLGPGGANCSLKFQTGDYYCIGVSGTATTTSTGSGGSAATAPGPTQTGIDPTCRKYAQAHSGDSCSQFAATNGITPDQLYAWNSVLGPAGANCDTQFWANEWYCVGASSTPTTPTIRTTPSNAAVTAPGPTQTGITTQCTKYAQAKAGETCVQFAAANNVATDQLYAWNGVLGSTGENCATQFWAGEWYCVGTS